MAQMLQLRCCDGDTGHIPQPQGPGSVVCRSLGGGGGDTGASLHSAPPPHFPGCPLGSPGQLQPRVRQGQPSGVLLLPPFAWLAVPG